MHPPPPPSPLRLPSPYLPPRPRLFPPKPFPVSRSFTPLSFSRSVEPACDQDEDASMAVQKVPLGSRFQWRRRTTPCVGLSLRTRESSETGLKRIFDQINASFESRKEVDKQEEAMAELGAAKLGSLKPGNKQQRNDNMLKDAGSLLSLGSLSNGENAASPQRIGDNVSSSCRASSLQQRGPHYTDVDASEQQSHLHLMGCSRKRDAYTAFGSSSSSSECQSLSTESEKPSGGQLTIFYAGAVHVYNDVPLHKANAIMLLAGSRNPSCTNHPSPNFQPSIKSCGVTTTNMSLIPLSSISPMPSDTALLLLKSADMKQSTSDHLHPCHLTAARSLDELPHARKASLARFLERRRERVQTDVSELGGSGSPKELNDGHMKENKTL